MLPRASDLVDAQDVKAAVCTESKLTQLCEPVRHLFESTLSRVINLESPDNNPNPTGLQKGSWGLATHAKSFAGKTRLHCNKF